MLIFFTFSVSAKMKGMFSLSTLHMFPFFFKLIKNNTQFVNFDHRAQRSPYNGGIHPPGDQTHSKPHIKHRKYQNPRILKRAHISFCARTRFYARAECTKLSKGGGWGCKKMISFENTKNTNI